jgi:translation initiation factor 2B subunit (eIF-2B alpha/beta/delta family)
MSLKQKEHQTNYMSSLNEDDNKLNSDFEEKVSLNNDIHPLIKELNSIKVMCQNLNKQEIRDYVEENMGDDIEELKKIFYDEFDNINDNNPIKMSIMDTLQDFGIVV